MKVTLELTVEVGLVVAVVTCSLWNSQNMTDSLLTGYPSVTSNSPSDIFLLIIFTYIFVNILG